MDKLWVKLLVIGIIVSLTWSAVLSWAVFYDPPEAGASSASTKLVRPTIFSDDDLIDERIDRLEGIVCPKRLDC